MAFKEEFLGVSLGTFNYVVNKRKKSNIRLAMAMQVKDEADIIELNIRYHSAKGCDSFFIVDNASTDGTREILESLTQEFDLTVIDDFTPDHNQSQNMTKLSHMARKSGFDWVIENDADEFWMPKNGDLKTGLDRFQTVLRSRRYNVLPVLGSSNNWQESTWLTANSIQFNMNAPFESEWNNFLLAPVLHKSMVNPHGLINVGGGNHGARHAIDKLKGRRFSGWNDNVKIFHFALRSFHRFKMKVENINKSLKYTTQNNYRKHNFGRHALYWNQAYEKGCLEDVFEKMLLNPKNIPCLMDLGLITEDKSLVDDFHNLELI